MLCASVKWPKPKKFVKTVHGKAFNMPGNIKKYFGLSLRIVLTVILVVLLAGPIYKLMKKEVGSRRFTEKVPSSSFPSIAICPYTYSPIVQQVFRGQNQTFQDIMKLPSLKESVIIDIEIVKPFTTK